MKLGPENDGSMGHREDTTATEITSKSYVIILL